MAKFVVALESRLAVLIDAKVSPEKQKKARTGGGVSLTFNIGTEYAHSSLPESPHRTFAARDEDDFPIIEIVRPLRCLD
jgi:hypothetical protein